MRDRYTVHYPSFANPDFPGGLDNWRVFGRFSDALRFATDAQLRLRRERGPEAAARVTIEDELEAAEAAGEAEYDATVNR
jgi:hypothetical protein